MASPLLPTDLAARLGASLVPGRATVHGFTHLSFFAHLDGRPCVVKAASDPTKRSDLRREAAVLMGLASTDAHDEAGLPVPAVLDVREEEPWTIVVLTAIEGTHGLDEVLTGGAADLDLLTARACVLGRVLARIHATPFPASVHAPGLDVAGRFAALAAHAEVVGDTSGRFGDEWPLVRDALTSARLRRGRAFVHGDAGFHNTLWTAERLVGLLDWEYAGWGNPSADLAWVWWTFRFRHIAGSVWEALVDGYGSRSFAPIGWSLEAAVIAVRAQMAALLVRTAPGSAPEGMWRQRLGELTAVL